MKITSKKQLIDFIIDLKSNNEATMTLYTAYSHLKQVHETTYELSGIHIGSPIHSTGLTNSIFLYYKTVYGFNQESLLDRNIPKNKYNDIWWFTTKESAEAYIAGPRLKLVKN